MLSLRKSKRFTAAREHAHGREPPAVLAPDVREDAQSLLADLVDVEAAASPRRFGRGWPKPGAIETTTACSPPGVASSNSRRSATVLWWMWPARTRSAPASTSPARTRFRFATGFLRERHGAPSRWWWSVTIRYAPAGTSRKTSEARRTCSSRRRPDWCRHGRTELSPATTSVSERYTGSVVSHSRSNSCQGRVNRRGNVYGMSWLPGIASSGSSRLRRKDDARSCWLRRPRWVRSPLAITRSGRASSTSLPSASIDSGLSFLPKCRSERWRTRVGTAA